MNKYLFVYGTLMKKYTGLKPINLEKYGKYICEGYIHGRIYEIDNFPGLIITNEPNEKVFGEIFLLNDFNRSIHELDQYEDFFPDDLGKSLYVRQIKQINVKGGGIKKAWVFIYNRAVDKKKRIVSGNYLDYGL